MKKPVLSIAAVLALFVSIFGSYMTGRGDGEKGEAETMEKATARIEQLEKALGNETAQKIYQRDRADRVEAIFLALQREVVSDVTRKRMEQDKEWLKEDLGTPAKIPDSNKP